MKNNCAIYILCILLINVAFANAQQVQKFKPYYFFTASAAASYVGLTATKKFGMPTKSTSVFDVSVQSQASQFISFGVAFAYQKFVSFDAKNSLVGKAYRITTLFNPAIVASYCYPASDKFNAYAQVKLNSQYLRYQFQYTDNRTNTTSKVIIPIKRYNQFNFQFGLGFNYYFNKKLGVNFEGALGQPYFMKFGINYRVFASNASSKTDQRKIEREEPIKSKSIYY